MADTTKPVTMTGAVILSKTLKLDDEPLSDFVGEIRKLTPEDKAELVALGAEVLGVEVAAS